MAAENGVRDSSSIHRNLCQLCGAVGNLMLCAGCRTAYYCDKKHQKLDWKTHKYVCSKGMKRQNSASVKSETHRDQNSTFDPMFSEGLNYMTQNSTNSNLSTPEGGISSLSISSSKAVSTNTDNNPFEIPSARTSECDTDCSVPEVSSTTDLMTSSFGSDGTFSGAIMGKYDFSEGSSESYILQSDTNALEPHTRGGRVPTTTQGIDSSTLGAGSLPKRDGSGVQPIDTRQTYIDVIESRNRMLAEYVIECLSKYGICVVDNFLGELKGLEILSEVKHLHRTYTFKQGQVVNASGDSTNLIRGDEITWVEGTETGCENIGFLVSILDAIMTQCSGKLGNYTISGRTKGMVACYPGKGTGYVRHVDNPNKDGRCVTSIYYLNRDWDVKRDGGLLRIFPQNEENRVANIEPKFDRLLFFWSDRRNPHEVQPAYKTRYAITVWFYDADERRKAVQRYYNREAGSGRKSQHH